MLLALIIIIISFYALFHIAKRHLINVAASCGISFILSDDAPTLRWTIFPPSVGFQKVQLRIKKSIFGYSLDVSVRIDKFRYIMGGSRWEVLRRGHKVVFRSFQGENDEPAQIRSLARFGTIVWSRIVIEVLEPHPRARLVSNGGLIGLYAPFISCYIERYRAQSKSATTTPKEIPLPLVRLYCGQISVGVETVTQIPIPLANQYTNWIKADYPFLFNLLFREISPVFANLRHPSSFPPPFIFSGIYYAMKAYKSYPVQQTIGYLPEVAIINRMTSHLYSFPIPSLSLTARIIVDKQEENEMSNVRVSLLPDNQSGQKEGHPVLMIKEMKMQDGVQDSHSFHIQDISYNWNAAKVRCSGARKKRNLIASIEFIRSSMLSIFTQPFYLASFAFSFQSFLFKEGLSMISGLKSAFECKIDRLEVVNKIPLPAAAVDRVAGIASNILFRALAPLVFRWLHS